MVEIFYACNFCHVTSSMKNILTPNFSQTTVYTLFSHTGIFVRLIYYTDTFILHNCIVISPSAGAIKVSCDSSHQIQVTIRCTNNCTNPVLITYGNCPLTVRGLDPGIMYSVMINVFDGSQVVLSDQTVTLTSTVMGGKSGIYHIAM